MSIMWRYLDKRSATIAAIKDFNNMQFIIRDTGEEIRGVYETAAGVSSPKLDDMPKAHNNSDLSDFMAQLEEYESKLFIKYEKLLGIEVDIYMTLDRLQDDDERFVLRAYYIDGMQWDQIALKVPCAERTVYDIRLRGLKSVAKILQSDAEKQQL